MKPLKPLHEMLLLLSFLVVAILLLVALRDHSSLLLAALLIGCAVSFLLWHSREDVLVFLIAAIIGPVAEVICIRYGMWTYATSRLFGIPVWLPLAWGLVGLFLTRMSKVLAASSGNGARIHR